MPTNKGINYERYVARKQREFGSVIRAAASGAGGLGTPDLIIGKDGMAIAIECKATKHDNVRVDYMKHQHFAIASLDFGIKFYYLVKFGRKSKIFGSKEMHLARNNNAYVLREKYGLDIKLSEPIIDQVNMYYTL